MDRWVCRLPAKLPPSQYWFYLSGRKSSPPGSQVSDAHRLGLPWNSNAYAISGHRKIFSAAVQQPLKNQYLMGCPRRSDIAPHYEVSHARYTPPGECAVREAMGRLARRAQGHPAIPATPRPGRGDLYRNCYGSMSGGALCHSGHRCCVMAVAHIAAGNLCSVCRAPPGMQFAHQQRDMRRTARLEAPASYAAAPEQTSSASQRQRY